MVAKRAIVLNYLTTDILTSAASCTLGVSRPSRGPELSAKVFVNFCPVLSELLQLNEYETAPYSIQVSQNLTCDCLLSSVFFPEFT